MTPLQQEQVAQSRALFPERQRQAELETDTQAAQLGGAQATADKAILQMHEEALKFVVHMSQGITPENYAVRRAAIVQLYPDAKDTLGEQYDPAQIARFQKEGLDGAQFFAVSREELDHALNGEYLTGLAKLFAAIPEGTPEAQEAYWQAAVARAEATGVPKEALDLFAPAVRELGVLRGGIPQRRYSPAFVERAKAALQVGQQAGTTKTPAAEKPPNVGSFEDYVLRKAKEAGKTPDQLTPADIERARKQYQQADDRAPRVSVTVPGGGSGSDAVAIAEAIIRGDQPPTTQGLYRFGAPVRAELAKRGYDLSTAQRD